MKLKQVGQKLHDFKNYIGNKTYGGIKSLGNKIYDNRYKIGAGLGAAALTAGALATGYYGKQSVDGMRFVKKHFEDTSPSVWQGNRANTKVVDNTDYPSLIDNRQVKRYDNPLFSDNRQVKRHNNPLFGLN